MARPEIKTPSRMRHSAERKRFISTKNSCKKCLEKRFTISKFVFKCKRKARASRRFVAKHQLTQQQFLSKEYAQQFHGMERGVSILFGRRLARVAKFNRVFVDVLQEVSLEFKSWIVWQTKFEQFNQIMHFTKGLIALL